MQKKKYSVERVGEPSSWPGQCLSGPSHSTHRTTVMNLIFQKDKCCIRIGISAIADPTEEAMRDEAHGGRNSHSSQMTGANSMIREGGGVAGAGNSSPSMTMIITIATCFGCLIFITNLIIVGLVLHRRHQRRNSKLKRIPGTDSEW